MNHTIRHKQLACTDTIKIDQFLEEAQTGYLGLAAHGDPYVIPLNFVWKNGFIYFHGASEGRKVDMLHENPNVCFTVSEQYGTMVHPIPAKTDTAYMSVILFGKAAVISDLAEATSAMQALLDKYVPGYYSSPLHKAHVEKYRSSLGSKTFIFKIRPFDITAKENELNQSMKFEQGRTVHEDR
ncbi:pyridoxamine 5'-phosphate oxidase family protein [Bacillus swezeyi]|uniref:pyridoxamine 5'-phosphate oxidase family protein n=1 Tax=Bacillus swezeyi TaxID=1925020 RepID=UPI000B9D5472|nr:pyridoxamine 5'-phosphate oxidase family protein [Bacillus swezeyi]MEC1259078.1 pyridoxamine 5'-phosphate oxidase family protein [Bacillus swezeyi]MED2927961.1 pyridoxamine 5'-phosphate oxidase family protein [Bacillus swezeyi]MED2965127.1 pyridoxamine 5'-phosphate oxidase family protein [Bacillus swezeyi]MED3071388.1 pyridoxamine 5'-phosphate oxidase family protein [Bacillus swezeyi]MED3080974.1 pyridoxamine 5'-phosphate oxidase family protein [Bacillus swezeyi]